MPRVKTIRQAAKKELKQLIDEMWSREWIAGIMRGISSKAAEKKAEDLERHLMNALHDLDIESLEYYIEGGYDYFLSIGVPKLMMNNGIKNINILADSNKGLPSRPEQVEQVEQVEQDMERQEAIRQEAIHGLLRALKQVSRKMANLNEEMLETRGQQQLDNLIYQRNALSEHMDTIIDRLDEAGYVHPPPFLLRK